MTFKLKSFEVRHWNSSNKASLFLYNQCEIAGYFMRMPSSEVDFQRNQTLAYRVLGPVVSLLVHGGLKERRALGYHSCSQGRFGIKEHAATGIEK